MKKVILAAVLAALMVGSTFATTVVTRFDGEATDYSIYTDLNEQFELVFGLGFSNQQEVTIGGKTTDSSLNLWGHIGVATDFPLIGKADVKVSVSKTGSKDLDIGSISLTKNALYNLTDDVAIGVSCDILTYDIDSKLLTFHKTIQPAISATIELK
ncbi:hypothetical protein HOH45_06900 [bacterium]|nr:hypothetical protein [bacterium]